EHLPKWPAQIALEAVEQLHDPGLVVHPGEVEGARVSVPKKRGDDEHGQSTSIRRTACVARSRSRSRLCRRLCPSTSMSTPPMRRTMIGPSSRCGAPASFWL